MESYCPRERKRIMNQKKHRLLSTLLQMTGSAWNEQVSYVINEQPQSAPPLFTVLTNWAHDRRYSDYLYQPSDDSDIRELENARDR